MVRKGLGGDFVVVEVLMEGVQCGRIVQMRVFCLSGTRRRLVVLVKAGLVFASWRLFSRHGLTVVVLVHPDTQVLVPVEKVDPVSQKPTVSSQVCPPQQQQQRQQQIWDSPLSS